VIGSNIFNILSVIGVTALAKPIETQLIEMSDLLVMLALTALLIPIMGSRGKITRSEAGFLLACYAGYCTFLWFDRVAV
jgi:cation:H+ antiporter